MEIAMITHDCTDPRGLAKFYAALLDAELEHESKEFCIVASTPKLGFQEVARPHASKNRVHIDLHSTDREAAVERAVELGARRGESHTGDDLSWTTMYDPEGNVFDIV